MRRPIPCARLATIEALGSAEGDMEGNKAMPTITRKGRQLAAELGCYANTPAVVACSLVCRHAVTYQRIQEERCNGPWQASSATLPQEVVSRAIERHEAWVEREDARLAQLIEKHAAMIPGISGVDLGGDPRGVCVKLIRTDGKSNSWGGESRWCVPLEG